MKKNILPIKIDESETKIVQINTHWINCLNMFLNLRKQVKINMFKLLALCMQPCIAQGCARDFIGVSEEGTLDNSLEGTEIVAMNDGVVVHVLDQYEGPTAAEAAGNHVIVKHGEHCYALYAHMQRGSIRIQVGDKVAQGQTLGLVGNTGNSTASHLHFQLTWNDPRSKWAVMRPLTNFAAYSEAKIDLNDAFNLKAAFNKKIEINNSGNVSWGGFLN